MENDSRNMNELLKSISRCSVCEGLPMGPRPIVSAQTTSKLVIIGQAPGKAVHLSGIPWDDKSGDSLRNWMGMDKSVFYDPQQVALIPMGFCYPGKGKSGDLPPRKECAPLWHDLLFEALIDYRLILLVGKYAQDYYLPKASKETLTENVKNFRKYLPNFFPLPHPSPRNNIWQAKNPWFKEDVIPALKISVKSLLK